MKNIDKIRNMNSKELANFILNLDLCVICKESGQKPDCINCYLLDEQKVYEEYFEKEYIESSEVK